VGLWARGVVPRVGACPSVHCPSVILAGMTYKVGPKGQVVLPKQLRGELGIEPGDDVLLERDGTGIRVRKANASEELWGSLPDSGVDPLHELLAERRRDRAREDRRARELSG
jgi:AbrB family looped-hinge helix DNA binding protein